MNDYTVVYQHYGILPSNKKEQTIDKAIWMAFKGIKVGKNNLNINKLNEPIYITFLK